MAVYDVGDSVRITANFANLAGAAADPTVVVAKYKNPAGTITTKTYGVDAEVVKTATGVYYIEIAIDASGEWWYRFTGTGAIKAAEEASLIAETTRF